MTHECVRYLPDGVGEPTTPLEVLLIARDLLKQEGRWLKGDMYKALDSKGYPLSNTENPYCGNWKVCAQGAVFAVAVGLSKARGEWVPMGKPLSAPHSKLYSAVMKLLHASTPQDQREAIFADLNGSPHTDVVRVQDFNDFSETTLADILAVFDAAIARALANEAPNPTRETA